MKVLLTILLLSFPLYADNPVLRVRHITKSPQGTEVELQPLLPPHFSAYVESGNLKEGEVIHCKPATRYTGKDEHGDVHSIIVLQCGEKVLLLKKLNF